MSERSLLLLDDEPNVLSSLERMLRNEGYNIKKAMSADEGMGVLENNNIMVIVSDQNMPGKTGAEFFAQVKDLYPNTIRILLTGETDLELVSDAVNRGEIYKYLVKPWDQRLVKSSISEAFVQHDLILQREEIQVEIKQANEELAAINRALQKQITKKSSELIKISQYDSLTSLPNRLLFSDRLSQAIIHADTQSIELYVLVIGIDRFNLINETYGHVAGDYFLVLVGERLNALIDDSITLARIGGDEFAVIFSQGKSTNAIHEFLSEIFDSFESPVRYSGHETYISLRIGISVYHEDVNTANELIKNAATAMRHAKHDRGRRYQYYEAEMNDWSLQRLQIENKLRPALSRNEYLLYFQPQKELSNGRFTGVEALLRWQPSNEAVLSPDMFIPILEETGMIIPVGEWVLRTAMQQAVDWHRQGITIPLVSVNISPRQFKQENLISTIAALFEETGFRNIKCKLELEVTENMLADDHAQAVSVINKIADMGINIAIDDFGTGYASLNYLTQLSVDTLKIDKSFISRLDDRTEDKAIIKAIIAMAHSLNIKVVAEGVETNNQLGFLQCLSCDIMQGYLFSRPVPPSEIVKIYKESIGVF